MVYSAYRRSLGQISFGIPIVSLLYGIPFGVAAAELALESLAGSTGFVAVLGLAVDDREPDQVLKLFLVKNKIDLSGLDNLNASILLRCLVQSKYEIKTQ